MPKLSDIQIPANRSKGKGIRPWNDPKVVKPRPNLGQTSAIVELDNNKITIGQQPDNNEVLNQTQTVHKLEPN